NMPYDATWAGCVGVFIFPNDPDADVEISTASHEHFESATDPELNAWYDPSDGSEDGDKCAYNYGTVAADGSNVTLNGNPYIIQQEWSNAAFDGTPDSGCTLSFVTGPLLVFDSDALVGGNGNGVVDPNECNEVTVAIRNAGTAPATSLVGTLSTSTAGVTITQGTSNYPDIGVGATGSDLTPFQISTSSSYVCGTPVDLTLLLTWAGGSAKIPITLP